MDKKYFLITGMISDKPTDIIRAENSIDDWQV